MENKTNKKKRTKIITLSVIGMALVMLIIWIAWGNKALELNSYTISSDKLPEAFNGFLIAQVSDLHNAEMGKDNEKLNLSLKVCADCVRIMRQEKENAESSSSSSDISDEDFSLYFQKKRNN